MFSGIGIVWYLSHAYCDIKVRSRMSQLSVLFFSGKLSVAAPQVAGFFIFSWGTRAQHLILCGVRCPCGVPWMDAMLQSVREERQLYSHNQCVQYRCTHSHGHNIDMNRAGILA